MQEYLPFVELTNKELSKALKWFQKNTAFKSRNLFDKDKLKILGNSAEY
jgi:hypothetical protein